MRSCSSSGLSDWKNSWCGSKKLRSALAPHRSLGSLHPPPWAARCLFLLLVLGGLLVQIDHLLRPAALALHFLELVEVHGVLVAGPLEVDDLDPALDLARAVLRLDQLQVVGQA